MKKLAKLKLNQLSKADLEKREMGRLIGGNDCCGCGCNGSSSTDTNKTANSMNGYSQSGGGNKVCVSWQDTNGDGTYDVSSECSTC